MDKSLGQRIKYARSQTGLTQDEAAKRLGIAYPTLSKYEQGHRTPDAELLNRMAKEFGCDPGWLLAGTGGDTPPPAVANAGATPAKEGYVAVPLYEVEAAAGTGAVPGPEQISGAVLFSRQWLKAELHLSLADLCLLPVRCDSMLPTLAPGDLVLIDRSDLRISQDGIYVYRTDDGLSVKRLQRLTGGAVRVISDNKDLYAPFEAKQEDLHLIGRVVMAVRRM